MQELVGGKMQTIMILGGSDVQVPLISRAKERGYRTVVVSPLINEPGKKFADVKIEADVRDKEFVLKKARELQINGIITDQTDIAVRTVAFVAEKMGLSGIGSDVARLFTDKFLMREKCRECGIRTLKYKKVKNVDEAISFFYELGSKMIMKPIDSQGSRGVVLIENEDDIRHSFDSSKGYSLSEEVLLEEFVVGREFVVEGIALNYLFENLVIGDTYYFDIKNVFSAKQRVFPTDANPILTKKVLDINKRIITSFGLKQGITHSEFIMNGDDVILIETAARGGGVFISSDLISLSTGLHTEDFLIDVALGKQEFIPEILPNKCACCYLAFYLPVGKVVSIKGIETVKELVFTHRNNLDNIYVGMETKIYSDKTSRFFVTMSANNREELDIRTNIVRKHLNQIEVITANGKIKGPIWDCDN